jgi:hypothetical protein
MRFAFVLALIASLGWYKEYRDGKAAKKKIYTAACFKATTTTFETLSNRSMNTQEIGFIGFTCERMSYKENL